MFLRKFGWHLVETAIRGDFEFVSVTWTHIGEVLNKAVIIYMGILKITKTKVRNDSFILQIYASDMSWLKILYNIWKTENA